MLSSFVPVGSLWEHYIVKEVVEVVRIEGKQITYQFKPDVQSSTGLLYEMTMPVKKFGKKYRLKQYGVPEAASKTQDVEIGSVWQSTYSHRTVHVSDFDGVTVSYRVILDDGRNSELEHTMDAVLFRSNYDLKHLRGVKGMVWGQHERNESLDIPMNSIWKIKGGNVRVMIAMVLGYKVSYWFLDKDGTRSERTFRNTSRGEFLRCFEPWDMSSPVPEALDLDPLNMTVINEDSIWKYKYGDVMVFVDSVKNGLVFTLPVGKVLDPSNPDSYPIMLNKESFLCNYDLVKDVRAELMKEESQMPAINKGSIWKGKLSNITVIIDDVKDGKVLLRPFGDVEKTSYPLSPMWISVENFFRSYNLECDTPIHNQTTTHTFPRIEPRFGPNSYKVHNLEFDHSDDFANNSFNVHATIEREVRRHLTEEDIFDARQFLRSQGHLIVSGDLMTEDIDQCPSRMPHTEHIWHAVYGDQVVQTTWTYKCNGREGV